MKNSIKTGSLSRTLPQQGLISNRRENMRKSVLIIIMAMVALMLWSPILAEAKGKHKNKHKIEKKEHKHWKHGKHGKLQRQINDLDDTVFGLENRVTTLEGAGGGTAPTFYSVGGGLLHDVPTATSEDPFFEVETLCNQNDPNRAVMSGGYDVRLVTDPLHPFTDYDAPLFLNVIGHGPNNNGDGWTVRVRRTSPAFIPATLEVTAVCFGQAP